MKKQLLATSALVAAGLIGTNGGALAQTAPASQPIQVTVGGYMYQFFGYVDQRDRAGGVAGASHPLKFLQTSDSEIYFQGKTTLANGISLGMRIELEGNTESDQIDESFGYVEGAFGRIEAGSTFAAAFKMGYHGPEAVISQSMSGVNALMANLVANPTSAYGAFDNRLQNTAIRDGDDAADKVSYYTPRFEGFQVGVSYAPEQSQDSNHHIKFGNNTYNNEVSAAINFVRAFGPFDTAIYAGYQHANKPYGGSVSNATLSDPTTYGFGAQIGYAGFRFGGSYTKAKNFVGIGGATTIQASPISSTFTGATDSWDQGRTWDLGLTYTFGPAVVGAYYVDGRNKNATGASTTFGPGGGTNTEQSFDVAGRYELGPGVQVQAMVFHAKTQSAYTSPLASQNATGVQTGFLLNF